MNYRVVLPAIMLACVSLPVVADSKGLKGIEECVDILVNQQPKIDTVQEVDKYNAKVDYCLAKNGIVLDE